MTKRRRSRTYDQIEASALRDLEEIERNGETKAFVEVTVGGAPHRRTTPQIVGPENVRSFKKLWGVCPTIGCSKIAGHDGECN